MIENMREFLTKMEAVIEERGWKQGGLGQGRYGPVCYLGAANVVLTGVPDPKVGGCQGEDRRRLARAISDSAVDLGFDRCSSIEAVNDSVVDTVIQARSVLRHAARTA